MALRGPALAFISASTAFRAVDGEGAPFRRRGLASSSGGRASSDAMAASSFRRTGSSHTSSFGGGAGASSTGGFAADARLVRLGGNVGHVRYVGHVRAIPAQRVQAVVPPPREKSPRSAASRPLPWSVLARRKKKATAMTVMTRKRLYVFVARA